MEDRGETHSGDKNDKTFEMCFFFFAFVYEYLFATATFDRTSSACNTLILRFAKVPSERLRNQNGMGSWREIDTIIFE